MGASATPATTATLATTATPATPTPPTAASTTATARGALTPSPRPTPTTATTATPAPTDTVPTGAKCTTTDFRSSTGRRDQPTRQYSMKCDEPTIRSKLQRKGRRAQRSQSEYKVTIC